MSVGKICVRDVWTATPGEHVREAARRMAEADVGTLVVLDEERRPVGIVTDRDVMLRCVAEDRDPDKATLSTIMTAEPTKIREETPIEDGLSAMARAHVRRIPVVDQDGRLVGLLAMDDVLDLLIEESQSLGRLLRDRR